MSAGLMVHRPGSPPEEVALAGPATAGGGPGDAVRIEGTPPRAIALAPSPAGVLVEALAAGAVLRPAAGAARPLAPGRRRILRPGESLRMADAILEVPADPPAPGTRVLAGRLLGEAGQGGEPVAGPHLLALEGPDAGRRLPLGLEGTLGRGRAATLRLADAGASRRHARVARVGAGFTLEDLGSKNGLRLNGAPVGRGPAALSPGDEIAFGQSVLALVLRAGGPAGAAPPFPAAAGAAVPGTPAALAPERSRLGAALTASAALLAGAAALAAAALWT
ncbi:MAG TPA: FHA domain-containing protein [Anaeromyxobacteraceae bacterium]